MFLKVKDWVNQKRAGIPALFQLTNQQRKRVYLFTVVLFCLFYLSTGYYLIFMLIPLAGYFPDVFLVILNTYLMLHEGLLFGTPLLCFYSFLVSKNRWLKLIFLLLFGSCFVLIDQMVHNSPL